MAVKKNVQQNRKAFVQAKLGQTGVEATPEQRAKLRERFNTLSQTKEGRTKIAKALLPGGTAAERKALKSSIRSTQTNTGSTTNDTNKVVTIPGMGGVQNNVDLPVGSAATSAFIPNAMTTKDLLNLQTGSSSTTSTTSTTLPKIVVTPTTLPNNTTSTTMVRNNTSTSTTTTIPSPTTTVFTNNASSAVVPSAQKTKTNNLPPGIFENFPIKGTPTVIKVLKPIDLVYGDQAAEKVALKLEQYHVPILGRVAGIGRNLDAGKNKEAGIGLLKAVALAATTRVLPQLVGVVKTGQLAIKTVQGLNKQNTGSNTQNTSLQNEFRLSEALKYERTSENSQTFRRDFGTVAEQRAGNPPPGNKDFKFPSIKDQQKAYEYKPPKTRAGEPGTSGKNFSLDEYGRPVKLPKIK